MLRYTLRRLILIPPVLLLVNILGYAYAQKAQQVQLAANPFLAFTPSEGTFWADYWAYFQQLLRFDLGTLPNSEMTITSLITRSAAASVGLLAVAFTISLVVGMLVGMWATRSNPPEVAGWLSVWSTFGQAMPSFYAGSLLIVGSLFIALAGEDGTRPPLPLQGFGWDLHLVMPVLALMARPTVQIAHITSNMLSGELGKLYVTTHRSTGHIWRTIRWRLAMRNILSPVILTVAQSLRLLVAELILVEWLFSWPGLGKLLAAALVPGATIAAGGTTLTGTFFLNPELIAVLVTAIAGVFLIVDLIASVLVQNIDPRLRVEETK